VNISEGWSQRDQEAYRAWKKGNQTGLINAYEPLIKGLARSIARASRRGKNDELRQFSQYGRREEGCQREANLRQDGLRQAVEVVDPDELYQEGCEALLDAASRYDPKRGPLWRFAYKRVRGAMRDLRDTIEREAQQTSDESSKAAALATPIEELVALLNKKLVTPLSEKERDDSVEYVALFLERQTLDDWYDLIQNTSFEVVRFFWWVLYQYADELDFLKVGRSKRIKKLGVATRRHWHLVFMAATDQGRKLVNISGPLYMEIIERGRRADGLLPAKVDDQVLGKVIAPWLGREKPIDGKTIGRWRRRIAKARDRPSTVDWNSITDPRLGRRIERRRRQNSH
jgi:Sigma-70 region 2